MGILDSFFDKEKMVAETITGCLENLAEELNCSHSELFIMIKPTDANMEFKCWVYRIVDGKPSIVREITLKEILAIE